MADVGKDRFGSLVSVALATDYGRFTIHVLPEKRVFGTLEGRPAAKLVEHYAMVPENFDPARPVVLHLHHPDIVQDLFAPTLTGEQSALRGVLEKAERGENGFLLVVSEGKDDDAVIAAFQKRLNAKDIMRVSPEGAPRDPDLAPFTLYGKTESVRLSMPDEVRKVLFPDDSRTVFFKDLTHYALATKKVENPRVRVHSACLTGDCNASRECDCGAQFRLALARVKEKGGAVIYHDAEGRGIHSLAAKMLQYKAKASGLDTYAAMQAQGYPSDARSYVVIKDILEDLGIQSFTLLTNNPAKVENLVALGLTLNATERLLPPTPPEAQKYLHAKRVLGGHVMEDEQVF